MMSNVSQSSGGSWREGLGDAEQAKVSYELQQWLDGEDEDALGLIHGEPGTAKIWARLARELDPARVDEFVALGLDAEEDMLSIPGVVTRAQLLALIRHPDIVGVSPVLRSQPDSSGRADLG